MVNNNTTFRAGASEIVITPPVGAPTLGTIQRSTGVHDELYSRALVLNDGKQRVAIISLDLIGMDFVLSDSIRDAIRDRTGISTIFVHCTHNHSAPFTIPWSALGPRWLAGPGKDWRRALPSKLAELVAQADTRSEVVQLSAGRAPVQIGSNRRTPTEQGIVMKPYAEGPIVPWVDVLRVDRLGGTPLAILFSHAAHPVIIHGSSRMISAEFPGFAARKLKERFGENLVAMFGQAFAANINGDPLRGGINAAEHAGAVLAEAAFQAASNSKPIPFSEFTLTSVQANLPLQSLPAEKDVEEAIRKEEDRLRKNYGRIEFTDEHLWDMQDTVESARSQEESTAADDTQPMGDKAWWIMDTILCLCDLLKKIQTHDERPLRFDAQLLRIGQDWSLLTATHELFAEYQLSLDKAAPT
ncbi:MAG TPA: neutral/alkaline non-lysosomal ceramidase N-terminal domain-containing protein, partial [Terriglobales bacterium]|nr:neutral/alkaline non-lysosomal ceramidase N-terminal domain-containing protein [Terriglobales bacterium]